MAKNTDKKAIYITTTLPYVNSDPHVGFALEIVQADMYARFHQLLGHDIFFNTGTDEHGVKIYRKAQELGKDIKAYVDEYAEKFRNLKTTLGLTESLNFIRTTDAHHEKAAQEFWRRCLKAGDIYKKDYQVKYCVGCELEKTDSELENGRCPIHPNLELETINEENYFFRLSRFKEPLLKLYADRPDFVVPDFRFNEIRAFVERGWEDFSISRLKSKMPWGVEVPDDSDHVMYVWFDAFVNYISAIGWPNDTEKFEKYWPVIQFAGKDQIRQQAAMWQAMLMSVGIEPSKQIVIHGFITSGGQKMSKSLGNVINPYDIVDEYGTDPLRYFLIREIHPFEDSDFTMDRFKDLYNSGLANGLGNLASRVIQMALSYEVDTKSFSFTPEHVQNALNDSRYGAYRTAIQNYRFNEAANLIWNLVTDCDQLIQAEQPFKKVKTDPEGAKKDVQTLLARLADISILLMPMLPHTANEIQAALKQSRKPTLFPRK